MIAEKAMLPDGTLEAFSVTAQGRGEAQGRRERKKQVEPKELLEGKGEQR